MLIDVLLDRLPHADTSEAFLLRAQHGAEPASIAWHTVANVYYVGWRGGVDARDFIVDLTRFVGIAPADAESVRYAASLPMADFEDALQVAAARACGARCVVTRNLADYARSPIPAISPQEALSGPR